MPAYSRLKARLCDQIHPLSDLVAQIVLQSYITNEAERLLKIDEQIQIAVILLFASHERAEDADLFDLKPMPKDWLLVSKNTLDLLKGFHLFLGTTKGRIVNKYDERLIFRLVIKIAVRNGQAVFSACCSRALPSHAGPLAPGPARMHLPAPVRPHVGTGAPGWAAFGQGSVADRIGQHFELSGRWFVSFCSSSMPR
jgi:hypothetical protein